VSQLKYELENHDKKTKLIKQNLKHLEKWKFTKSNRTEVKE
jgi:hypothetical protein